MVEKRSDRKVFTDFHRSFSFCSDSEHFDSILNLSCLKRVGRRFWEYSSPCIALSSVNFEQLGNQTTAEKIPTLEM